MDKRNRVVWSEGLFLLPQLFQQQERYLEHLLNARVWPLSPYFWGFSKLEIDTAKLALGVVSLNSAAGIFRDGTPFEAPAQAALPEPLEVRPEHTGQRVYLTLPLYLPDSGEISFDPGPRDVARYGTFEADIPDTNSLGRDSQTVLLAGLRLILKTEDELTARDMGLAVTKIESLDKDSNVRLTPEFVPPAVICEASPQLEKWLHEILGHTHKRAEDLARMLTGLDRESVVPEIRDYFLMMIVNRYEPQLAHLAASRKIPPESVYVLMLSFAGELSTFLRGETKRPLKMPDYAHHDPGSSLAPLVEELRRLLNSFPVRAADRLELEFIEARNWRSVFPHQDEIDGYAYLVLCARSRLSRELLAQSFADQAKLAHPEALPELARRNMPGLSLAPLPVAPRQISFDPQTLYFEVKREGHLWAEVKDGGVLGLRLMADYPDLQLSLWGIRNR